MTAPRTLTLLAVGDARPESFRALAGSFTTLEQVTLALAPDADLADHKAEVHRSLSATPSSWVLILRAGERVSPALASEIGAVAIDQPRAWGFRLRVVNYYCGKRLQLGSDLEGEVRLLHRRHARFDLKSAAREMKVEGAILRLLEPLEVVIFESGEAHRRFLEQRGARRSPVSQMIRFLSMVLRKPSVSGVALRYLWVEAGY